MARILIGFDMKQGWAQIITDENINLIFTTIPYKEKIKSKNLMFFIIYIHIHKNQKIEIEVIFISMFCEKKKRSKRYATLPEAARSSGLFFLLL